MLKKIAIHILYKALEIAIEKGHKGGFSFRRVGKAPRQLSASDKQAVVRLSEAVRESAVTADVCADGIRKSMEKVHDNK